MEDIYTKRARQYEADAHFEELKGSRRSPQKIAEAYENAGDAWSRTKELPRADMAYSNALKYARRYLGEKEVRDIERKRKEVNIENKRMLHGLEKMKSGLEKKIGYAFLSIVALVFALVLVSFNLTGNTIGGINFNDMKWIGACFFLCGLTFAFLYLKNKK